MKNLMPTFVYRRSPGRTILTALGALVMAVVCLLAFLMRGFSLPGIICLFGVVFFGLGAVLMILRYSKNPVALIFTNEGFYDTSSMIGPGKKFLIPWEAITVLLEVNNDRDILIKFSDPQLLVPYTNRVQQKLAAANKKMYGVDHALSTQSIKGGPGAKKIIGHMKVYMHYRNQQLRGNGGFRP